MKYLLKQSEVFMNKKFWYLTKVSFNKKVKTKWFLITNIILLVAIVALFNISSIIEFFGGDFESKTKLIVVDNAGVYDIFETNLATINDEDIEVTISSEEIDNITNNLTNEELVVVINTDENSYLTSELISNEKIDSLTYQEVVQALNSTKATVGMMSEGIDADILANISSGITVERSILNESMDTDENMDMVMSTVFPTLILPFFMLIMFLVQMVGGEICEEKTTRSMEIIIGNVSPKMHLMSKVLSSNLFVILQGILLILYCVVAFLVSMVLGASEVGSAIDIGSILNTLNLSSMGTSLIIVIPIAIIMIILSFIAYALVAGILASMTVNIEDFNQLQTPIMLISLAGYYLAIMAAMFDGSIFIRIISYIPFLSVFISPTLFLLGQITVIDMLISVVILILFIYAMLKSGLKVYKTGILNYSSGKVWSRLFKAFRE